MILLVDDDPVVLEVSSNILTELGFEVVTAVDGQDAIEVYQDRASDIVCVILDLTMPRMDGREAFQRLRRLREDLPIILTSGHNEQEIVSEFAGRSLTGFLRKPYRLAEMIEQLQVGLGDA